MTIYYNLILRVDEFVQDHISYITGSMNIIGAKLKQNDTDKNKIKEINDELPDTHNIEECFTAINQELKIDFTSIALITDNINEVENWKGLGEPKKKN